MVRSRISMSDLIGNGDGEDYPLAQVLQSIEQAAEGVAAKPESHADNMQVIADELRQKIDVDPKGTPVSVRGKSLDSGFGTLDGKYGLLHPGLIFLVGPQQVGKSAFAIQLSQQVIEKNRVPVFYFAYGDAKPDVVRRFILRNARVTMLDYINGNFDPVPVVRAAEKYRALGSHLYIIQGTQTLTVETMDRLLLATLQEHYEQQKRQVPRENSCFIVVDYLQAVPEPTAVSSSDRIADVAEGLKDIVKKYQVPVLVVYGSSLSDTERTVARSSDFQVVVEKQANFDFVADSYVALRPMAARRDVPAAIAAMNRGLPKEDRIPEDVLEAEVSFVKNKSGMVGTEELWYAADISRWYCPADVENGGR